MARPTGGDSRLLILTRDPVELICDPMRPLFFSGLMQFEFEVDTREGHDGGWKIGTRKYSFSLKAGPDDSDEFMSWHWDRSETNWPEPHAHAVVERRGIQAFDRLHIPTGRVFFEEVLIFAIKEFHAKCDETALDQLADMARRTRRWATWL